jgi:hypothetical protein
MAAGGGSTITFNFKLFHQQHFHKESIKQRRSPSTPNYELSKTRLS